MNSNTTVVLSYIFLGAAAAILLFVMIIKVMLYVDRPAKDKWEYRFRFLALAFILFLLVIDFALIFKEDFAASIGMLFIAFLSLMINIKA